MTSTEKVAVVTGAFGLLGRQHVVALSELGYKVVGVDNKDKETNAFYEFISSEIDVDSIHVEICNIRDEIQIQRMFECVFERYGRLDALINNAAINPTPSKLKQENRIESFDESSWLEELGVGLTGAILMCKYSIPLMKLFGSGSIVNIASDLSVIAPDQRIYNNGEFPDSEHSYVKPLSYSVIKTALHGLTKYLSTYLARDNIRVNTLSPGGVFQNQNPDFVVQLEKLIPLGRMAFPTDFRGAIKFLCSEESQYMTGQNIVIDGGRSVW